MSKKITGTTVEPKTQEQVYTDTDSVKLDNTNNDSTVEQQLADTNKLQGITVNGELFDINLNLTFKADVKQAVATKTSEKVASLVNSFTSVSKRYYTMLSDVAIIIGNDLYKTIVGVKTPQQLLMEIVGTSKTTASEMCSVAKRFYNADGTLKYKELGLFTYSELVKLKGETDDVIENVVDKIKAVEKHTRADVEKAIKESKLKAIGVDTEEEKQEEKQEETTEQSETSETTDNTEHSEDFHDTNGETPFKTDWQSEYIKTVNTMTEKVDQANKMLEQCELIDDYRELSKILINDMSELLKTMLEKITE